LTTSVEIILNLVLKKAVFKQKYDLRVSLHKV